MPSRLKSPTTTLVGLEPAAKLVPVIKLSNVRSSNASKSGRYDGDLERRTFRRKSFGVFMRQFPYRYAVRSTQYRVLGTATVSGGRKRGQGLCSPERRSLFCGRSGTKKRHSFSKFSARQDKQVRVFSWGGCCWFPRSAWEPAAGTLRVRAGPCPFGRPVAARD